MDRLKSCISWFKDNKSIFTGIPAGVVMSIVELQHAILLATLIFTGSLEKSLDTGVKMALTGFVTVQIIVSILSPLSGLIVPIGFENFIVIVKVYTQIGKRFEDDQALATAIAFTAINTIMNSLFFGIFGFFRLSKIFNFVPFPVRQGILASICWLIFLLGLQVTTTLDVDRHTVSDLFEDKIWYLWCIALAIGIILFCLKILFKTQLVIPAVVVLSIVVYQIIVNTLGYSTTSAREDGWIFTEIKAKPFWNLWASLDFSLIDWDTIIDNLYISAIAAVLSLLDSAVCLNAVGPLFSGHVRPDNELMILGLANFGAILTLGMSSSHDVVHTSLHKGLGGNRESSIYAGIVLGVFFFAHWSIEIISYIPKFVIGSLVFYFVLVYLKNTMILSIWQLSPYEYVVMIAMLTCTIIWSFEVAIGLGILASFLLFVWQFSHYNRIRLTFTGRDLQSTHQRTTNQLTRLQSDGEKILVIKLEGYLFFGSTGGIVQKIVRKYGSKFNNPVKYLIMDMELVTGIDTSAVQFFSALHQRTSSHKVFFIMSDLNEGLLRTFQKTKFLANDWDMKEHEIIYTFPELNDALEFCENKLLDIRTGDELMRFGEIAKDLWQLSGKEQKDCLRSLIDKLTQGRTMKKGLTLCTTRDDMFDIVKYNEGDVIVQEGQPAVQLFVLVCGEVIIGKKFKLYYPGTVFEVSSVLTEGRVTTTVVSGTKTLLLSVTKEKLDILEQNDPALAIQVYKFLGWNVSDFYSRLSKKHQVLTKAYDAEKSARLKSLGSVRKRRTMKRKHFVPDAPLDVSKNVEEHIKYELPVEDNAMVSGGDNLSVSDEIPEPVPLAASTVSIVPVEEEDIDKSKFVVE